MKHPHIGLRRRDARRLVFEIALILLTFVYLLPFYAVVTLSMKSPQQALYDPMSLPTSFYTVNYQQVWELMRFPQAFSNSLVVTGIGSAGISLLAALAAFPIARKRGAWNIFLYYLFIGGLLIPYYMTLSPLVKLMRDLGLMNSVLGLAVAYVGRGLPLAVFMYVGFMRAIPGEILDSGVIDGCSPFRLFFRIIAPMTSHVTTTLVILNVLWIWNDFLFPLLMLQSAGNRTIPLAQYIFHGSYATSWNLVFASYLLSMLPLLILYFMLQRYVVEGVTAGALKA
jgi:raffinose/stachyose/melibiose transport system permease protein